MHRTDVHEYLIARHSESKNSRKLGINRWTESEEFPLSLDPPYPFFLFLRHSRRSIFSSRNGTSHLEIVIEYLSIHYLKSMDVNDTESGTNKLVTRKLFNHSVYRNPLRMIDKCFHSACVFIFLARR